MFPIWSAVLSNAGARKKNTADSNKSVITVITKKPLFIFSVC